MTQDVWLERYPFLRPIAALHEAIGVTVADVCIPTTCIPTWENYASDFRVGIPLLKSSSITIDLQEVEEPFTTLVRVLASKSWSGMLAEESRVLNAELQSHADAPRRAVAWLLDRDSYTPQRPGLLNYVGWTLLTRYLHDLVSAFGKWREEERWLRHYCPLCGARPAMAQLVGVEHGRLRLLSCGCCGTRWHYHRVACPFCGNADDQQLAVLSVEGDGNLRIDYCEACGGYLKTYNGEGNEGLLLADWTSLHLDILACDRGLNRFAESLFQLGHAHV